MDFLQSLENNSILIVPNNIKEKILTYIETHNILKSIKIINFTAIKKGLLFDYTNETIFYVMKNYNVSYSVAKEYINNLYYIEDKKYKETKLIFLQNLKNDLDQKKLLIYDELFLNLVKSKNKVYIYGFDFISKFNKELLKKIEKIKCVEEIEKKQFNYNHPVYELNTLEEEVLFVAEKIADLIKEGVEINKIYITNYNNEYSFWFEQIFSNFGIPVYLKNEATINQTVIGQFFLDNLDNNLDNLLFKIKRKFLTKNNRFDELVYNKLASFCNNYYWVQDILEVKELITEEMKKVKIPIMHMEKEVKIVELGDNIFDDDEYVFLIGFNLGSIPIVKRDEDYINDAIKPDFLEKTDLKNKIEKNKINNCLKNIKNLVITYKINSKFASYKPSLLAKDMEILKVKNCISKYSMDSNKVYFAKKIDRLVKFNEYSSDLALLNNSYSILYNTYKNDFKGLDEKLLLESIQNRIVFSYSNISTYYECPFKFYVEDVLGVYNYEEKLSQVIGNVYHYCLEKCLDTDASIDEVYDEYIETNKKVEYTNKDLFFIHTLKEEIKFVIEAIRNQYKHSLHDNSWKEKKLEMEIAKKIKVKVKGFVDKVLLLDNYAFIIDYKTNSKTIDKNLFQFGLGIQLPIYLYFLKKLEPNIEVMGMYLQHILNLNLKYSKDKSVEERKQAALKLDGITIDNLSIINKFDDTIDSSEVIQGLALKNDGTFKKSKRIISKEEREELTDLIETLIINCIDNVLDGKFNISPIKIESKADGCHYCEYKDICYRKKKDFNVQIIKSEEGENNE